MSIDEKAVGNAKLDGLTDILHITGNQYLFLLTIYFIGYVSVYIPGLKLMSRGKRTDGE